jgi:5-methylcytosine-specific restriction endonuclease McrA
MTPGLARPCLNCGTPVRNASRCPTCAPTSTAGRGYGADWQQLRLLVLVRDGHRCHWCGQVATTVDHVRPLAHGGARLDPGNLVAACLRCNSARGARTGRKAR